MEKSGEEAEGRLVMRAAGRGRLVLRRELRGVRGRERIVFECSPMARCAWPQRPLRACVASQEWSIGAERLGSSLPLKKFQQLSVDHSFGEAPHDDVGLEQRIHKAETEATSRPSFFENRASAR